MSEPARKFNPRLTFYKPRQTGDGAASQWELAVKGEEEGEVMVFLSAANQDGEKKFAWDRKLIVKLGSLDLGEILAVLTGRKNQVGAKGSLFHQTPGGGNSVVDFAYSEQYQGYTFRVSKQSADKKDSAQVRHLISLAEGEILRVLLESALLKMHGWG